MKKSEAFITIDIAFSLLILSFAFVLLLQAQNAITKNLQISDITNFQKANENLFHNIAKSACKNHTITTKKNHTYALCMIESKHDSILLRYYTTQ